MGFRSDREVADELFRSTGWIPYIGDRHTSEFFACYITNKKTLRKYKLHRTTIAERKKKLLNREKELAGWLKAGLPDAALKKSRETAADILSALVRGKSFIDVGNVANTGQIDNLPRGLVVETPVLVDANGFTPIAMGPLPAEVLPLVEPWADVFILTLEAGLKSDRALALRALCADPVCAHLTTREVNELGAQLLTANERSQIPMARGSCGSGDSRVRFTSKTLAKPSIVIAQQPFIVRSERRSVRPWSALSERRRTPRSSAKPQAKLKIRNGNIP